MKENKLIVGEDMICPINKKHCDDECCTVGSTCNLSSDNLISGEMPSELANNENETYIGTKIVNASPMYEWDFLRLHRGKTKSELDKIKTQGDGYLVEYEDGYKSWSPKETFERSYRKITIQEKKLLKP